MEQEVKKRNSCAQAHSSSLPPPLPCLCCVSRLGCLLPMSRDQEILIALRWGEKKSFAVCGVAGSTTELKQQRSVIELSPSFIRHFQLKLGTRVRYQSQILVFSL